MQIRAKDPANNYSAPAVLSFRIDLSLPTILITSGPEGAIDIGGTPDAIASFTLAVTDSGGGQIRSITCLLDGNPEAPCSSAVNYQITGDGATHVLTVKAVDNAGNIRTLTRSFSYTTNYSYPYPGGDGGV